MLRKTVSKAGAALCSTTQDTVGGETESFCDVEGFLFFFFFSQTEAPDSFDSGSGLEACMFLIEPVT